MMIRRRRTKTRRRGSPWMRWVVVRRDRDGRREGGGGAVHLFLRRLQHCVSRCVIRGRAFIFSGSEPSSPSSGLCDGLASFADDAIAAAFNPPVMYDPPCELSAKRDRRATLNHRAWNAGARGGPAVIFLLAGGDSICVFSTWWGA